MLRVLELAHETFSRRLSSGWGSELRSIVQVEPLGMDQMSYDDHIRSMPNPNVVLTIPVPPLPGSVIVDLDTQLAIQMVERLLGANPMPGVRTPRRPSEVESDLIAFLGRQAVAALADTLAPLLPVDPQLENVEYNPQLVQVAAPSDSALLLSYRVTISQGLEANGIVTIAYPSPTLTPLLEQLEARRQGDERDPRVDGAARAAVAAAMTDVPVTLSVQLNPSRVPLADLTQLQIGDVLRLDHRLDAPARGVVGGDDVLVGHLGRRGRRLAVQVRQWRAVATPPDSPASASVAPRPDDVNPEPVSQETAG